MVVGSGGGTFELRGRAVTLVVPAGATSGDVVVTADDPEPVALPNGTTGLPGAVFDFGPEGTQFDKPIDIRIAYDPGTLDESLLRLFAVVAGRWELLQDSSVDTGANIVSGSTDHFSVIGVLTLARFCPGDLTAFQTFEAAQTALIDGGTIEVCTGTHAVENALIEKPLTVEGLAGAAIDGGVASGAFVMNGVNPGAVIFHGLEFEGGTESNISVIGSFDLVEVVGNVFHPPSATLPATLASGVSAVGASGGHELVVEANDFLGGDVGVRVQDPDITAFVLDNLFEDQGHSGVLLESSGHVEGNILTGCGVAACILVGNDAVDVGIDVVDNVMERDAEPNPFTSGIQSSAGRGVYHIIGNTVIGLNPDRLSNSFGFVNGIRFTFGSPGNSIVEISENTIRGVREGLLLVQPAGLDVIGLDNVIDDVADGIIVLGVVDLSLHSSDVTNAGQDIGGDLPPGSLTCNWWDSPLGPQSLDPNVAAAVYTPWATAPVAGTSTTTCSGGPP